MKKVLFTLVLMLAFAIGFGKARGQTTLSPGDLVIVAINGDGDTGQGYPRGFSCVTLVNLEANTVIYFTEYGWSDNTNYFITNTGVSDHFVKYTVPSGGQTAGTIIRCDASHTGNFTALFNYAGTPPLNYLSPAGLSNGDEILVFQASYNSGTHEFNSIQFICAASIVSTSMVSSGWATNVPTNGTDGSGAGSALPLGLTDDVNAFSFNQPQGANDNCAYNAPITPATKEDWQIRIKNYSNWTFNDAIPIPTPPAGPFTVTSAVVAPTVTTQAVSSITGTTAIGNGNITSLGVPNPTQYGVVWSTSTNPIVALTTKTTQGVKTATGAFTSSITGLTANTKYYVRAYATNTAGTSYGSEVNFTTSCPTTPVDGLTTFNSIPSTYTEYSRSTNASAGISASNAACSGWDISGYTTSGSNTYIIASENWGPSGSDGGLIYLALESGTQTILSMRFKSNDGKLFDLNSIDLGYDVVSSNVQFTITGYKNGSAVSGATYTVPAFSSFGNQGTWKTGINISTNTNFQGIDEFRITPNTAGQLTALDVDNINATNFRVAPAPPTIASFSPTNACSGSTVTITGTNFTGATAVSFGGTAATSFSVVNSTSITAVVANGNSGSVGVTTAGGTGTKTGFTLNPSFPGTITYSSAISAQTVVVDGQAGSTDYCGITLNVYSANSALTPLTNAMTYEPNIYPGASGVAANYATSGGCNYIIIKSSDNSVNFSLQSLFVIDAGGTPIKIEGFDNGSSSGSINYNTNTSPWYFTLNQSGVLTPSKFQNVDEVRISATAGGLIYIAVNNIQLANPVTATAPTVTTQAVSSIAATTAIGNGNITSLGVPNPTQYGVVWSTSTNPTVALTTKTTQGVIAATGAFTSSITGLTANTQYYVRAYATNTAGTSYGSEVNFTTTAASTWVKIIPDASAIFYGVGYGNNCFITSDYNNGKMYKSTDNGQTWSNPATVAGTIGYFSYGDNKFVAADNNYREYVYYSTDNGNTWTGSALPTTGISMSTGAITYGDGKFITCSSNGSTGSLFASTDGISWSTVFSGSDPESVSGLVIGGLCYGNGLYVAVGSGLRARIFTSTNTTTWTSRSNPIASYMAGVAYGNNIFVALSSAGEVIISSDGITWSSSPVYTTGGAYMNNLTYGNGYFYAVGNGGLIIKSSDGINWTTETSGVTSDLYGITYGNGYFIATGDAGVILVKTSPPTIVAPTVTTQAVSSIAATTAIGNGNITATGGANITERGIYYSTSNGFADGAGTKVSLTGDWSATGAFTQAITGLTSGTTYYVKAFAKNSAGTSYGTEVNFTTLANPTITSATYNAFSGALVVIGTNLTAKTGATNDIDATKFTITGQDGGTYTLTSATRNVEITSATAFTLTISGADKTAIDALLNKNGLTSVGGTTYNLAAADNWCANITGGADLTGNGITVSNVGFALSWVNVGNPGNTADATTFGAVANEFSIMQFEFTNSQYANYLNSIDPDGTNPNSVYNASMGTNTEGGITFTSGASAGSKYIVKSNMGDKPVNYNCWWDVVRVCNWLHNGAPKYASTDATATAPHNQGAYNIGTSASGNAIAKQSGALYWIPTENQWYKAAYYNGNSNSYTTYGNGYSATPTQVSANATGVGSAGTNGNYANYLSGAAWNSSAQHFTTVGSNGSANFYGAYDMSGNVWELNDRDGLPGVHRGFRGGDYGGTATAISKSTSYADQGTVRDFIGDGFRLASNVVQPTIGSATYSASTGNLAVSGIGFMSNSAGSDIDATKFTITGQGGGTYTLTAATSNVEITSGLSFTLTVTGADKTAVDALLNKNGTSSVGGTTYNIAAAANWCTNYAGGADLTGNGITVSGITHLYYVDVAKLDNTGNGLSWATAKKDLQSVLDIAVSGDQIWVAKGTYKPSSAYDLTNTSRYYHFRMINGVAIYGGFAGTEVAISGRTNFGVGQVNETILSGDLNGDDVATGSGATLSITGNTENCYHVLYHPNGLALTSSAILDGFTIKGGNANGSDPHNYGAGVYNNNNNPTFKNCKFFNNASDYRGGAIAFFSSNSSVVNSIFFDNSAGNSGGGVFLNNSNITFTNTTITKNYAWNGGGIWIENSANVLLNNSILWGNTKAGNGAGTQIGLYQSTITLNFSCYSNVNYAVFNNASTFTATNNNITSDPNFIDATNDDFRIYGSSPCVDAGNDTYCTEAYDIRGTGFGRKLNKANGSTGTIDMGAFEYKFGTDIAAPSPELTTTSISAITSTTATAGGNVTNLNGANITAHGVCWNTTGTPTTDNTKTDLGAKNAIGTFTTNLSNLTPNTVYYLRAYATNPLGTGYGEEIVFHTPASQIAHSVKLTKIARTPASVLYENETDLSVQLEINDGAFAYTESFSNVATNELGFFSVNMGTGTKSSGDDFSAIAVNNDTKVKVSIKTNGEATWRTISENNYLDIAAVTAPISQGNIAIEGNLKANSFSLLSESKSSEVDLTDAIGSVISIGNGQTITSLPTPVNGKVIMIVNLHKTKTCTLPGTLGTIAPNEVAKLISVAGNWYIVQ